MPTIIARSIREIGAHYLLAARAVIVGWVSLLVVSWPVLFFTNTSAHPWLFDTLNRWVLDLELIPAAWRGHTISRSGLLILGYIAFAAAGWMVARFHPVHRNSMVLAFLASVLIASLPYLYVPLVGILEGRETMQVLLTNGVMVFGGRTASVLLGGFWNARFSSKTLD